jgi:hypothetical protein
MGAGSFDAREWDNFSQSISSLSIQQTFSSSAVAEFDPTQFKLRESCESAEKPRVTPIIIALDVTGSMGKIPAALVRGGLGDLMAKLLANNGIPNPHVMFMAVGDVNYDRAPIQATQFEADMRMADQLRKLYLEGGGGGNDSESYPLAWYFAATRTKLDSLINRQEKGFIFTIGDEYAPEKISGAHIQRFLGEQNARDITTQEILTLAKKSYEVFHFGVKQSSTYTSRVQASWKELLGQNLIDVDDYNKIADDIVSTIETVLEQRNRQSASIANSLASRVAVLSGARRISPVPVQMDVAEDDLSPPPYSPNPAYRMGRL